jgi:hypothetical protein
MKLLDIVSTYYAMFFCSFMLFSTFLLIKYFFEIKDIEKGSEDRKKVDDIYSRKALNALDISLKIAFFPLRIASEITKFFSSKKLKTSNLESFQNDLHSMLYEDLKDNKDIQNVLFPYQRSQQMLVQFTRKLTDKEVENVTSIVKHRSIQLNEYGYGILNVYKQAPHPGYGYGIQIDFEPFEKINKIKTALYIKKEEEQFDDDDEAVLE